MGMFTSIIHPDDGRELQIKTGTDQCEWYKVGDTVRYYIDPKLYGMEGLADGVYTSYGDNGSDDLVVIKDHVVVAVEPQLDDYKAFPLYLQIERYTDKWGIKPTPPTAWPWKARIRNQIRVSKRFIRNIIDSIKCIGKTPEEKMAYSWGNYVRTMMRMPSFSRLIMPPEFLGKPLSNKEKIKRFVKKYIYTPLWEMVDESERVYRGE